MGYQNSGGMKSRSAGQMGTGRDRSRLRFQFPVRELNESIKGKSTVRKYCIAKTRKEDIQLKRPAEGEDHVEWEDRLLERGGPEKVGLRDN